MPLAPSTLPDSSKVSSLTHATIMCHASAVTTRRQALPGTYSRLPGRQSKPSCLWRHVDFILAVPSFLFGGSMIRLISTGRCRVRRQSAPLAAFVVSTPATERHNMQLSFNPLAQRAVPRARPMALARVQVRRCAQLCPMMEHPLADPRHRATVANCRYTPCRPP